MVNNEMIKCLTVNQIIKACDNNNYIAARFKNNDVIGINCRIAVLSTIKEKNAHRLNNKTNYISYKPISFSEYIRIKYPFISTTEV